MKLTLSETPKTGSVATRPNYNRLLTMLTCMPVGNMARLQSLTVKSYARCDNAGVIDSNYMVTSYVQTKPLVSSLYLTVQMCPFYTPAKLLFIIKLLL